MSERANGGNRIHVEREGRVEVWRIDYPPHNFMTRVMVDELAGLVERIAADDGIGARSLTRQLGHDRKLSLRGKRLQHGR